MTETQFPWRLDPDISYSDWTIEVTRLNDRNVPDTKDHLITDIYRVHKTFLSCGPRTSTYFYELFHSTIQKCRDSTTRLNLQKSAADAFPEFLDFVYGGDLKVTPESAVALHYLSGYFGVESLNEAVFNFVRNDMLPKQSYRRNHKGCIYCTDVDSEVDSVVLESCMKSATRWEQVRDHLVSSACDRASLVELMTKMLTLEQKNLLFFYALQEPSGGWTTEKRGDVRLRRLKQENQRDLQLQQQETTRAVTELTGMKEKVITLENQNEAYSHAFSTLKSECLGLETKNNELWQRTQKLDILEEKVTSLTTTNDTNEKIVSKLEAKVHQLEQENIKITQDNEANNLTISTLTSTNEKLEKNIARAKEKHQNQIVSVNNESAMLMKNQLLEISKLKGDSAKIIYQYQSEAARWKEENAKLRRQCELLEELYWTGIGR
jgi:hypothetical protein